MIYATEEHMVQNQGFHALQIWNGYVWSMIMSIEKCTKFDKVYKDLEQSTQIVMVLIKPFFKKDYCVAVEMFTPLHNR